MSTVTLSQAGKASADIARILGAVDHDLPRRAITLHEAMEAGHKARAIEAAGRKIHPKSLGHVAIGQWAAVGALIEDRDPLIVCVGGVVPLRAIVAKIGVPTARWCLAELAQGTDQSDERLAKIILAAVKAHDQAKAEAKAEATPDTGTDSDTDSAPAPATMGELLDNAARIVGPVAKGLAAKPATILTVDDVAGLDRFLAVAAEIARLSATQRAALDAATGTDREVRPMPMVKA